VEDVRAILTALPPGGERFDGTIEAARLQRAHLDAEVLGRASEDDALHVANATVSRADLIASWNFRHIVHFDKIRGCNAVDPREGCAMIAIHAPKEVV
jgi:hypothetical protein